MAVDANLGKASVAIRATLDQLDKDLGNARKQTEGAVSKITRAAGKNFQTLGKVALGGIGVATGAVTGLAGALGKIAIDAAPVEAIGEAFRGMAEDAGYSQGEMLAALQEGSSGMVSQRDLMLSFNKASQLVSKDFATQLPDAMQYLSKVSAATGEDMSFMMDSLVTGVGRMSPMILDNLGIQVKLSDATERAAEMFGVQADELEDSQVQAGMMNVVLEKLQENTAAMPDATDSAAAKMAQMKATFQDTKDQIGMALLPVLSNLMGAFSKITDTVLPPLISFFENTLAPVLQTVSGAINDFFWLLGTGIGPVEALRGALEMGFGEEVAGKIMGVVESVIQFGEKLQEFLEPIMAWISENVELQDVLIALGAAIASVIIPILVSIVSAVAPVIAVFIAVVAIVTALRKAWESNFLGIRDKTQAVIAFVGNFIRGALERIQSFWAANGQQIMATVSNTFETVRNVVTTVITAVRSVIQTVLDVIRRLWSNHGEALMTAASNTWEMIQSVIESVIGVIQNFIQAWISAIQGDWEGFSEHLQAVWEGLWDIVSEIVSTAIENIKTMFGDVDWGAVGLAVIKGIANGIRDGAERVAEAAKGAAKAAFNAAKSILGIGSPSKLFEGIGQDVMEGMIRGIASMEAAVEVQTERAMPGLSTIPERQRGSGLQGLKQINIYGLTLEGVRDREGLLGELQALT